MESSLCSSSPLNIASLSFHVSHPDTYSLLRLDSLRLSSIDERAWSEYGDLKMIGPKFLKRSLTSDKELKISSELPSIRLAGETIKKWLLGQKKELETCDGKKRYYYVIRLFKKSEINMKSLNLMNFLTSSGDRAPEGFICQANLLLFPSPEKGTEAMAYGFGKWTMLLDHFCILPKWGLTVYSSSEVCDPERVKSTLAHYYRTSNPSSRNEKVEKLTKIETFRLEVGSQGLESIRGTLNEEYKMTHLTKAADYFQFSVDCNESGDDTHHRTIESLEKIATYFLTLTNSLNFKIHARMKEFVDEEVKDKAILTILKNKLIDMLKDKNSKHNIFVDDSLWGVEESKSLKFGYVGDRLPLDAIRRKLNSKNDITVNDSITIEIHKKGSESRKEIEILPFLYSNPIEIKGEFYRLNRGKWFRVDTSRFESIKRIMREKKISQDALELPSYSIKDTQPEKDKTIDYKEAKYNMRVAEKLGKKAILLDRLHINLGKSGNIFEFGDILLIKDGNLYIIHVKRFASKQLSHLREQVERTAHFLATELKKTTGDFLLNAIISGLYRKCDFPSNATKGKLFGIQLNEESEIILTIQRIDNRTKQFIRFKEIIEPILRAEEFKYINNHQKKFLKYLDCLYNCFQRSQWKKAFEEETIPESFESFKQSIELEQILFNDGVQKKENTERIKIVLAVIDDRKIEKSLKVEKTNEERIADEALINLEQDSNVMKEKGRPLFHKQDLWGLDRTSMCVEKLGFGFHIAVINEEKADDWDVFGEIIKQKAAINMKEEDEQNKGTGTVSPKSSSFDFFGNQPSNADEISLKGLFEEKKGISIDNLDLSKIQRLDFTGDNNDEEGLYSDYLTCPTKGDGDCFFHAVFTAKEEGTIEVQRKAAEMRKEFCNLTETDEYLDDFRNLMYESYLDLYSNGNTKLLPQDFCKMMSDGAIYQQTRNGLQHFGVELPERFTKSCCYEPEDLKSSLSKESIKAYMERLREVGGEDTYIPVRKEMKCPAEIIALTNNISINIFTFDIGKKSLCLFKKIRSNNHSQIVNVLFAGSHFTRLYGRNEDDDQYRQAIRIIKNSENRILSEMNWKEDTEEAVKNSNETSESIIDHQKPKKTDWKGMEPAQKTYNEVLVSEIEEDLSIITEGEVLKRKKTKM